MDYSPPGSSIHGILQARILEWVAISYSRGSSDPGIEHTSPAGGRRVLYCRATGEALLCCTTIKLKINFKNVLSLRDRLSSQLNDLIWYHVEYKPPSPALAGWIMRLSKTVAVLNQSLGAVFYSDNEWTPITWTYTFPPSHSWCSVFIGNFTFQNHLYSYLNSHFIVWNIPTLIKHWSA